MITGTLRASIPNESASFALNEMMSTKQASFFPHRIAHLIAMIFIIAEAIHVDNDIDVENGIAMLMQNYLNDNYRDSLK